VTDPTVIAVDWSGAKRPNLKSGIWLAQVRDDRLVESRALRTREEAIDHLLGLTSPFIAGFDFSFGVPEWFATERGCSTVDDVWAAAGRDGERWLAPTPPFWRDKCELPREKRFRACEERYPRAKSVFQLVGAGMVGPGSIRGMPLLAKLRAAGVAIWPFDPPGDRTVFEIYPSALRPLVPQAGGFVNEHERDAACSAMVMWRCRETVAALRAATDPTTRLEGNVWAPTTAPD
jgi:hypothetical protein